MGKKGFMTRSSIGMNKPSARLRSLSKHLLRGGLPKTKAVGSLR